MTSVLIVDDEPAVLEQAKVFLERKSEEIEVDTADSAVKALEMVDENNYDAIVSDYKMPEMDGLELLKRIREYDDEIPFIFLTGKGEEKVAMNALNLGANRYLIKESDPRAQYNMLTQTLFQEVELHESRLEQERMRSELAKSEKKYRTIFDATGTATVLINEDGTISLANKGFQELTGYTREELIDKKKWLQFVNEKDTERVDRFHKLGMVDTSLSQKSYEMRLVDKNNRSKNVYVTLSWVPETQKCIASILDFTGFESPLEELKSLHASVLSDDKKSIEKHLSSMVAELFEPEVLKKRIKDWGLEEIFLLLIAIRDGANGKELGEDLRRLFNISLSTSIVYPCLYELEEAGFLRKQEHIRTKEYLIKDEDRAMESIQEKIKQLFGIYSILKLLSLQVEMNDRE